MSRHAGGNRNLKARPRNDKAPAGTGACQADLETGDPKVIVPVAQDGRRPIRRRKAVR